MLVAETSHIHLVCHGPCRVSAIASPAWRPSDVAGCGASYGAPWVVSGARRGGTSDARRRAWRALACPFCAYRIGPSTPTWLGQHDGQRQALLPSWVRRRLHHSPQARRLCIVTGRRCTTACLANATSRARVRRHRSACTSRVGWPSSRACPDANPIGACSVHARLYKSPPVSRACQGDSGAGCGSSWPLSREPAALAAEIALWPGATANPDLPQQDPGSAQPTGFASDLRTDAMAPCAFQHR